MPRATRVAQRSEAKVMRELGEQVILLLPQTALGPLPTDTPVDIVGANTAFDLTAATRIPIFAFVKFHKISDIKYEQAGRAIFRTADIETTTEWADYVDVCYAVQISDGSILRKESANLSDTQTAYIMTCSGYVKTPQ